MFLKENMNPKGWKCGDCVIRACAKATERTWDETFQSLYEIAFKKKRMLNDPCVYEKYLLDNGFERYKQKKDAYGYKVSVEDMSKYYGNDYILVIHTRKHLTCMYKGTIVDSWNTSRETSGYYYAKKVS